MTVVVVGIKWSTTTTVVVGIERVTTTTVVVGIKWGKVKNRNMPRKKITKGTERMQWTNFCNLGFISLLRVEQRLEVVSGAVVVH